MEKLDLYSFAILIICLSTGSAEIGSFETPTDLIIHTADSEEPLTFIIKKLNDNLTLVCQPEGPANPEKPKQLFWAVPDNTSRRSTWSEGEQAWLSISGLQVRDRGRYTCTSQALLLDTQDGPDTQVANVIVVIKPEGTGSHCGLSNFPCGEKSSPPSLCISYRFVCDGHPDCPGTGLDESPATCGSVNPCQGKPRCPDGRCIPQEWCCSGRPDCFSHPCCPGEENGSLYKRTGGGLRRQPNGPPLLQTTLYTASACLLIFLIAMILFIMAICKAHLKRVTNHSGLIPVDITPDDQTDALYSNRVNSSFLAPRIPCPTYSQSVSNTTPSHTNQQAQLPSYFDLQINQNECCENTINQPLRRPTDFGVGTLANAIFNARYQPVPQNPQAACELSDSDSPGSHNGWSNVGNVSPRRAAARLGSPISNASTENRRQRRANALDRILDRFGLNAPYAVGRNVEDIRSRPENQAFLSPNLNSRDDTVNLNGRRRFVSSILSRLRNGLHRSRRSEIILDSPLNQMTALPERFVNVMDGSTRRRPDTPNVVELSLEEAAAIRRNNETYTLNGRTILLGPGYETSPNHYGLSLQGLYIVDGVNLNRFDRPPSPPPPYVSRENLLETSNTETDASNNNNVNNGNTVTPQDVNAILSPTIENVATPYVEFSLQTVPEGNDINGNFNADSNLETSLEASDSNKDNGQLLLETDNNFNVNDKTIPSSSHTDISPSGNNNNSGSVLGVAEFTKESIGENVNFKVTNERIDELYDRCEYSKGSSEKPVVLTVDLNNEKCDEKNGNSSILKQMPPSSSSASMQLSAKSSIFPPSNLEYIDSDCTTY